MMAMNMQYKAMPMQACTMAGISSAANAPKTVPKVQPTIGQVISPPKKGKLTSSFSMAARAKISSVTPKAMIHRL